MLLIVDDCAVSEDVKKWSNGLIELAFSGCHKGFLVWLLTQQNTTVANIPPGGRRRGSNIKVTGVIVGKFKVHLTPNNFFR